MAAGAATFVSKAALKRKGALAGRLGLSRMLLPVKHTRDIGKKDMIHNSLMPKMEVDAETYEVRANGELLTCEPAKVLPMAQRYFLY